MSGAIPVDKKHIVVLEIYGKKTKAEYDAWPRADRFAFWINSYNAFTVRLVLFTLVPTGFISLLPVTALRDRDPAATFLVLGAAILYAAIAVFVFERGLRRYASGNRVLELR